MRKITPQDFRSRNFDSFQKKFTFSPRRAQKELYKHQRPNNNEQQSEIWYHFGNMDK